MSNSTTREHQRRLDKARVYGMGERLILPGQIALVYTREHEAQMCREFTAYLQHLGPLETELIDVLLEDLQGVHGARLIRVKVPSSGPTGWAPTVSHSTPAAQAPSTRGASARLEMGTGATPAGVGNPKIRQ